MSIDNFFENPPIDINDLDDKAMKCSYALTPYQTYMIDYQLYTPLSTMFNMFALFKFDKNIFDMEQMPLALERAIKNHPALLTKFYFNEDGEIQQKYSPELFEPVSVEHITEAELENLKDSLVDVFKITDSRLYRTRVFDTEKAGYIFFDVHNTIFDWDSFQVVVNDIVKAYNDIPLQRDYYFYLLSEFEKTMHSQHYRVSGQYFKDKYCDGDYMTRPMINDISRENHLRHLTADLKEFEYGLADLCNNYGIEKNVFFNFVTMLSIAIFNEYPNVQILWTYNGRDEINKLNGVGLLLCDLPIAVRLTKKELISDLYSDVETQISEGIEHSDHSFTMKNYACVESDKVCFTYQKSFCDDDFRKLGIEMVDIKHNKPAAENIMNVQVLDGDGTLKVLLDYNSSRYKRASMEKYLKIFVCTVDTLVRLAPYKNTTVKDVLKAVKDKIGIGKWWVTWMN